MIHYEDFERERLDPIYDIVAQYSEMAKNERYFLNGMIRYFKPKKILEAGVSSGGGSAIILNAISDIEGAKLFSVDYSETAYRYPEKPSGFLVEEKFSNLMDKWQIYRGGDVSRFVEKIGDDIDMLVLDTAHSHPGETLNCICILPFMKKNFSWTVLHDVTLYASSQSREYLACRYLFGHVVSDEKITPKPDDKERLFSNIGAFKVSEDTTKYANNLFESLLIPFSPIIEITEDDFNDMSKIVKKYYSPEQYKFFCDAFAFQKYITDHPVKKSFFQSVKEFAKLWQPGIFYRLKKIKRSLKK